ncbi:EpsG family protein [Acinetobacter baumannii]|uniref:EpsG family protein n=1 Tax=Acinetobacter baumannii TaxID=470 RepID=UPI00338D978B
MISIFFYIIPYILLSLCLVLNYRLRNKSAKFLTLISSIPLILVPLLKGMVGVDTYNYYRYVESVQFYYISNFEYDFEPLFVFLVKFNLLFTNNPYIVLNIFSFYIIFILFSFFFKDKDRIAIFISLVLPVFYYDMTMNGIRYGLAFALSGFFIFNEKMMSNRVLMFFAFLCQKTSIFFLFLKYITYISFKRLLILLFFSLGMFFSFKDYIDSKIEDYSNMSAPNIYSGLTTLFTTIAILFLNSVFYKENRNRNNHLLFVAIFFYGLVFVSYAGLRFQYLLLYFIIVSLCLDQNLFKNKKYTISLYCVGFIYFLYRMYGFYSLAGVGDSPFLPYTFFWE